MGALKIMGLKAVEDVSTTEDVDILEMLLVTDPLKITHYINFWRQEAMTTTANQADKDRANKMIALWLNYAERQCVLTTSIYSFEESALIPDIKEEIKETIVVQEVKELPAATIKTPDVKLTIVRDDNEIVTPDVNRLLRTKYESIIKKINVESLKQMCIELIKNDKSGDAMEVATFILSNGFYTGKKVKQWSVEKIANFMESCREAKAVTALPTTTEPIETVSNDKPSDTGVRTEDEVIDVISDDIDLYKKYANYVGDHAITLASLKVETKISMSHGEVEKGLELALFLLSEGLCSDSTEKWSDAKIEEWIRTIKQELIDNPDTMTSPQTEQIYDVKMVDLYAALKARILLSESSEEKIKEYILDTVQKQKIENLDMFYQNNNTKEELEDMYATFFISFVSECFKQKAIQALDATVEITKYLQKGIDNGEKAFGSAVQSSMILFKQKGEKVSMKEARDIVYKVAEEKFPEQYKVAMDILNKTKSEEKKPIIQADTKVAFSQKYPVIWENIKDTNPKSLDDVYNMARELEKTQSFLIVSEMIMHFISSGKINDKDGNPVTWELPAIEMWINTMFKEAETVAETETKVVEPTVVVADGAMMPASLVDPHTPGAPVVETTQVTGGTTEKASMEENTVADTTPITVEASTEVVEPAKETIVETLPVKDNVKTVVTLGIPGSYAIPEDKLSFKGLYAKSNDDFWHEFKNNIKRLESDGMSKKDIIHTMSDVIKAIAMNDDLSQCHARNFKRTKLNEMYKIIEAKAAKFELPGWTS